MKFEPKYKRVLIKISGEALGKEDGRGIDEEKLEKVVEQLVEISKKGVEVALVIGAGNFWRGRYGAEYMERTTSDYMGMLATTLNALAMQDMLESKGIYTRVMTAIEMRQIAELYIRRRAVRHLEKGRVVIFACGTGSPYFTTDSAAALRAIEIEADVILLAKNVDGVYNKDPKKYDDAKKGETKVTAGYKLTVKATIKGKDDKDSNSTTINVYKIGGKWCLSSPSSMF